MSTPARDRSSAGDRSMTSSMSSAVSKWDRIREAPWLWLSDRRAITPRGFPKGPIPSTRPAAKGHDKDRSQFVLEGVIVALRAGSADLPLHTGRVPAWLGQRMAP